MWMTSSNMKKIILLNIIITFVKRRLKLIACRDVRKVRNVTKMNVDFKMLAIFQNMFIFVAMADCFIKIAGTIESLATMEKNSELHKYFVLTYLTLQR